MSLHKLRYVGVRIKVGRVGYGEAENCFSDPVYEKRGGKDGFLYRPPPPFPSSLLQHSETSVMRNRLP